MRRTIAWLLLAAALIGLCGCGTGPAQTHPTVTAETQSSDKSAAETQTIQTEPQAESLEGNLFLKVSAITFSVVGETDDIYLGVIPREEVTWESDDPSIVAVENGVLTATGVGTTTIRPTQTSRLAAPPDAWPPPKRSFIPWTSASFVLPSVCPRKWIWRKHAPILTTLPL